LVAVLADLLIGAILLVAAAAALQQTLELTPVVLPLALFAYLGMAMVIAIARDGRPLTPADRVTLGRGVLVMLLVGLLAAAGDLAADPSVVFALALVAVLLDGVDGLVARRLDCATEAGGRFDMELDAFLLLVLCLWLLLLERAGAWVLLIGLWRYAFVAAGWGVAALKRPLPPSQRRRVICAVQGLGLAGCLIPGLPALWSSLIAAGLLILVSYSFVTDIAASWRADPSRGVSP